MRYLPSDEKDATALRPANSEALDEDDAFDVTAHLAKTEDPQDEVPYESVTLKILRKIWRVTDPRLNGFGPGLLRLAGISLAAFLPAWGIARATAALSPITTATVAASLAAILATVLIIRSHRHDNLTTYSRLHLGLLAAGAMSMAGWLPEQLLITLIGPMGIGYGAGSILAIFILAFVFPRQRPDAAAEVGETTNDPTEDEKSEQDVRSESTPDVDLPPSKATTPA